VPAGVMMRDSKPKHSIIHERIARTEAHGMFKVSDRRIRPAMPDSQKPPEIIGACIIRVRSYSIGRSTISIPVSKSSRIQKTLKPTTLSVAAIVCTQSFTRSARRSELGAQSSNSAHWLRHAHASHAIDRGAALPVVQSTLSHRQHRGDQPVARSGSVSSTRMKIDEHGGASEMAAERKRTHPIGGRA